MRDEDGNEASRIPVKPAPVCSADKGGKNKNRVARGQVHARVEDDCEKERGAFAPPCLEEPLYKAPPVYFLAKTDGEKKQYSDKVLRQLRAACVYGVQVLCPPGEEACICVREDEQLVAQPEDPVERYGGKDADAGVSEAPLSFLPGNFS